MVAHFSIEKWHMFHFDVLFSNGSQGYFFDYKLVNIWLDKIIMQRKTRNSHEKQGSA